MSFFTENSSSLWTKIKNHGVFYQDTGILGREGHHLVMFRVLLRSFNLLKPTSHVMHKQFNLLKPTGYVMHQHFNIQQL